MAVTIKKKALTLTSLVTRLFAENEAEEELKKAQDLELQGYILHVSPTTFSVAASDNATVLGSVSLKSETVTLCTKNKLGFTVKNIVKAKVKDLTNVSYQKWLDMELVASVTKPAPVKPTAIECYDEVMLAYGATKNKVAAIKKFRELTGTSLKEAKDQVEAWLSTGVNITPEVGDGIYQVKTVDYPEPKVVGIGVAVDMEADMNASPVPLKEATKLNQPVCGTSGGSIYHVIALGESCVVAARIKSNNEIAIRAEVLVPANSTEGQKARSGLKFAGLDQKPAGHWSLHLEPEDFGMVKRSLGSTLMAMSIHFDGVTTNLHPLQGVGK